MILFLKTFWLVLKSGCGTCELIRVLLRTEKSWNVLRQDRVGNKQNNKHKQQLISESSWWSNEQVKTKQDDVPPKQNVLLLNLSEKKSREKSTLFYCIVSNGIVVYLLFCTKNVKSTTSKVWVEYYPPASNNLMVLALETTKLFLLTSIELFDCGAIIRLRVNWHF